MKMRVKKNVKMKENIRVWKDNIQIKFLDPLLNYQMTNNEWLIT